MRVLVCGGRHFANRWMLADTLLQFAAGARLIIHGDCPTGADMMAKEWAKAHHVMAKARPAEWGKLGNIAGNTRNFQMLDFDKPDFVIAFPGGRGTRDMVNWARAAGLVVIEPNLELYRHERASHRVNHQAVAKPKQKASRRIATLRKIRAAAASLI